MIVKMREPLMGHLIPNSLAAPVQMARLADSGAHVGMLVDQHYTKGVEVMFFGRRCMANPLIAQLARQTGCPIHGVRVIRNPDGNSFVAEITEEIVPVRDANGEIDLTGTMQAITVGGRALGARNSRAMALAAPPLALRLRGRAPIKSRVVAATRSMSAWAHFPDSSRTSPEVWEGPILLKNSLVETVKAH